VDFLKELESKAAQAREEWDDINDLTDNIGQRLDDESVELTFQEILLSNVILRMVKALTPENDENKIADMAKGITDLLGSLGNVK